MIFFLNLALQRNPKGNPAEIEQNPAKKFFLKKSKNRIFYERYANFVLIPPPRQTFELFKSERNKF